MPSDTALLALDPDEIRAIRENIADAKRSHDGPPTRILPETLCSEIDTILAFVESYAARGSIIPSSDSPG